MSRTGNRQRSAATHDRILLPSWQPSIKLFLAADRLATGRRRDWSIATSAEISSFSGGNVGIRSAAQTDLSFGSLAATQPKKLELLPDQWNLKSWEQLAYQKSPISVSIPSMAFILVAYRKTVFEFTIRNQTIRIDAVAKLPVRNLKSPRLKTSLRHGLCQFISQIMIAPGQGSFP